MDLSLYVFYMRKRFMGQTGSDIVHEIEMPDCRSATDYCHHHEAKDIL